MPSPNEYRALELGASSAVASPRGAFGKTIKVVVISGALGLTALMVYSNFAPKVPRLITDASREEFRTTQFPGPEFQDPQRPQLDQAIFTVPPPPPEPPPQAPPAPLPPPTTIAAPPLPVAPITPINPQAEPDDSDARRRAELERQRRAEEERQRWMRLRAAQLVADGAQGAAAGPAAPPAGGSVDAQGSQEDDPNRRFLANVGKAKVEVSAATKNARVDALVAQGTLIPGILETAIQSDLPGMVRAVTSDDVWSFDGRRVLIPGGSRLIGEYRSGLVTGQTRVFIVWTRLLRQDWVSVDLGSQGTDDLGRAGLTGTVDKHYLERFGSAIMLSLIGGASQFIGNLGRANQNQNGATTTVTNPDGTTTTITQQPNQQALQARQIATQQIAQTMNTLANEALRDSLKIPPTIHVDQGERIIVFVKRDLDFASLYPDPLREALQELRRERRSQNSLSR